MNTRINPSVFASSAVEGFEDRTYRKIVARVLPLLVICYLVAYLDRVNIGFAKLQMLSALGMGDAAYALGASIFFWGYFIFEVPSNLALHRTGARIWIARIMVTWGICSGAVAFTHEIATALHASNEHTFYALRFLLGVSEAGFFPGMMLYLTYWFPANRQSNAIGWVGLSIPASMVIGGPLSGWIMQNINGHLNFGGWQWMIFLEALPAVILGVVVLIFMVDRPEKARWLSAEEKELVIGQLAVEGARKKSRIGEALRDPRVWLMVGIIFTCNTGFYGLSFWLPSILKNSGVQDPFVIGLLFALPYGCGAVVALLNARHANAVREYRWHAVVPAVIAGFALIAAALTAKSVPVSMTFIVIAACGQLSTSTVIWSFPARILSQSAAAVGIGLINSLGSLSGISGAMVFSYALSLTNNVNVGTSVIGCSLLICAVLIHVITARGRLNPN